MMEELHRTLMAIGFAAGDELGLVLAGGYALAAHGITDRPSQDVDFATATALPMSEVLQRLASAYREAGCRVEFIESSPRMARLRVLTGDAECEVDVLKEAIGPAAQLHVGSVLAFDDAVGLKVRALHERAAHRDYIDVRAAGTRLGWPELESLGARHTVGFSLADLADRLGGIGELMDDGFERYGLGEAEIAELSRWATEWESDIRSRLAAGEHGPAGPADDEWDSYLDRD
jgi:hypothetical protein